MIFLRWTAYILFSFFIHLVVLLYITKPPPEAAKKEIVQFTFVPSVELLTPPPVLPETPLLVETTSDVVELTEDIPPLEPEPPQQEIPKVQPEGEERTYIPFYAVDTRPSYDLQSPIVFPLIEKRRQKTASVIVEIDIDENGTLQGIRIVKSAGENFDTAVINAMKDAIFTPGTKNGQSVAVRTRFTIKFELD